MSDFFPTLVLFIFIAVLIYILVYYVNKVSELLHKFRFSKVSLIYWCIVIFFGFIFFILKFSQPAYTRVSCFPQISENNRINISVAHRINCLLQKNNLSDTHKIIYDFENVFENINVDSVANTSYLTNFGNALELDYLFLVNTRKLSGNYCVIEVLLKDYREKSSHTFIDTLYFKDPQQFFIDFNNQFKYLSADNYSLTQDELLHTEEQWQLFGKAFFYQLTDQYIEAEEIFRSLSELLPDNICIKKQYISVLLQKAIFLKSLNEFNQDIYYQIYNLVYSGNGGRNDSVYYKLLGKMYVLDENWNFAFEKLYQALQLNPTDAEIYFYLSKLHPSRFHDIGYSTDIELLNKAIFLNPAYLPARLKIGQIYMRKREFKKVQHTYNDILAINPVSIDGLYGLGKMYLLQNKPVDFINIYKKILKIDPNNSNAFYNLGIAYLHTREIETAEKFFRRAIETGEHANSYFYLGVIYALKNNNNEAISYFTQRIQSGKDDEYSDEARKAIKKLKNNEKIIHLQSFHGFGK